MAIATKFTHPNRSEPAIQLQLTQQEADWLHKALDRASQHTQSTENQTLISSIKDALTPVTGYKPS
jgi:hypothetical protein